MFTRRTKLRKGFTLVEILISIGILSVGIVGVISLLSAGVVAYRRARNDTLSALVASNIISDLQAVFIKNTSPPGTDHWDKTVIERYEEASAYFDDYEQGNLNKSSQEYEWVREFRDAESPAYPGFFYDLDLEELISGEYVIYLTVKWGSKGNVRYRFFDTILVAKPY